MFQCKRIISIDGEGKKIVFTFRLRNRLKPAVAYILAKYSWFIPCVPGIVDFINKDIKPQFFKLLLLCTNNFSIDIFAKIKARAHKQSLGKHYWAHDHFSQRATFAL
jgi:hypothetical protein